jgi:hypothetical protein
VLQPDSTNHGGISQQREQLNEGEVLYACPACGAVVSNHDPAAMQLHHLHVINPAPHHRAAEALRERMEAQRAEESLHKERHALFLQEAAADLAAV